MLPIAKRYVANLLMAAFLASVIGTAVAGSSHASESVAKAETIDLDVRIGFDNQIKLGSWAPITFRLQGNSKPVSFKIVAPDGNGLPVATFGKLSVRLLDERKFAQAWIKVGRTVGTIQCTLFDADDNIVVDHELELGQTGMDSVLDSTVPMILTLEKGDALANVVDSIGTQLFAADCKVIPINDATHLPENAIALQGIQVVYITTSDVELIDSVSDRQWKALEKWVKTGGKVICCAGKNADQVLGDGKPLSRFVPGKFVDTFDTSDVSKFERYTMSKKPLIVRGDAPITVAKIDEPAGIVELTVAQDPIIIRRDFGFGQLVFSAVDLETEPMSEWVGQKSYLMRLTFGKINLNRTLSGDSQSRGIVQYGYQDILGQLIFPLEKFSKVQFINFTVVAVLIAFFILCIGPGDYFFLRNVVGKMEWTWVTFTMLAAGFCGLAYFLSVSTKPSDIQINQLEIIDFDSGQKLVRGNLWTNIYSPSNTKCDVSAPPVNSLGLDTTDTVISWMGLPGPGLGGMKSKTTPGIMGQGYDCYFDSDGSMGSRMSKLPVRVSSTKSLHSQYATPHELTIPSQLRLNPTTNQLQGTVTNPFDVKLTNCRLVFESWAYVLDRPLLPQESVDVFTGMKERTANSYFTRRVETEDSKGGNQPWNPQEDNMDRIAELIMFFNAANGRQYTGMTHSFQPFVDMSEHLNLQRAVLFGRLEGATTQLKIESSAGVPEYDRCRTYVRLVLPVQYKK